MSPLDVGKIGRTVCMPMPHDVRRGTACDEGLAGFSTRLECNHPMINEYLAGPVTAMATQADTCLRFWRDDNLAS